MLFSFAGVEYDLGLEGAFSQFVILVGSWFSEINPHSFANGPGARLQAKGFQIVFSSSEADFFAKLEHCDIACVISNNYPPSCSRVCAV